MPPHDILSDAALGLLMLAAIAFVSWAWLTIITIGG
jgi:hypothetical protein